MTRAQWLRACGNLLQMRDITQSASARQFYQRQYQQLKEKLDRDKRRIKRSYEAWRAS